MRSSRFALFVGAVALVAPACGGRGSDAARSSASEPTRPAAATTTSPSSSPGGRVTLRVGTNDPSDQTATATVIEEFARQVDERSDGSLEIEPAFRAAGDPAPDDWDQAVARMVVRGDLDMGLIPSAAWDTEGVTSLQALNAPFLIDSNELVDAVVHSDLADTMLRGLDAIGITGLALLPESLRHVFAYGEPLLTPADFAGRLIRAPRSATVYSLFEALGSTVDDLAGSHLDEAVNAGSIAGYESSYARAATLPGGRLTATGNLTPFPKVNTLVINRGAFEALSDRQRAVLRDAAEATLSFALSTMPGETASAQEFCAARGSVALASEADLAALAGAVQPVYDTLEQDAVTKSLIAGIRRMKAEIPGAAPGVAPCDGQPAPASDAADQGSGATIPNGTYTRVATTATGQERGLDPDIVAELLGPDGTIVINLKIADGRWTQHGSLDSGADEVGDFGTYTYDGEGHWVTVSESGGCHGCVGVFNWKLVDGVLSLSFAEGQGSKPPDDAERLMAEGEYQPGP